MVQYYDSIPQNLLQWIMRQQMLWVATAPLSADGNVNVSPKGIHDTFHIVNPNQVWYEDLSGSGVETIAHVKENERITVMFSAFEGPPMIVRLWGKGVVHEFGTPGYNSLIPEESRKPGSRSAIVVNIHKVSSSCGYAVPYYEFISHRTTLLEALKKKDDFDVALESGDPVTDSKSLDKGIRSYWINKNLKSIDGLPGLTSAPWASRAPKNELDIERVRAGGGFKEPTIPQAAVQHITSTYEEVKLVVAFGLGIFAAMLAARVTERMGVV